MTATAEEVSLEAFPPIAQYGFLSDCENNCLVAPNGSVEWLCLPRPDSPSVFASVLDRSAGNFRFGPYNTVVPHQRRYIPGTMVLESTWHTPTGWLIVQDLLVVQPVSDETRRADYRRAPGESAACATLLRLATCIEGHVEVVVNVVPVFEYGLATGTWSYEGDGYGTMTVCPPEGDPSLTLTASMRLGSAGARCYGRTTLQKGETAFVALSWDGHPPADLEEAQTQLASTVSYWREWLSNGTFPDHPWRSYMERSALTLKGLSYAPTGAIMAAPTTSLPETPGGARNWDYRYTWIRDSSFMLRSLYRLGFDWEALEYFAFVLEALAGGTGDFELQIMYGIDGRKDLTERTLDHLTGWRNSRPVRVGNGAWDQHQNDVWGMILDAVDIHLRQVSSQIVKPVWEGVAKLVDSAIAHAGDPDQGIWEIRGDPQHFTASKVLCWVAMDRGADLARGRNDDERAHAWRKEADDLKAEILDKGVGDTGPFPSALRKRRARRIALAHPHSRIPARRRRACARHRARHRRRADRGRTGPALQGRLDGHRIRGQRRHLHHLFFLAGDGPVHDRRAGAGAYPLQEVAQLRRPVAALCGGDRRRHGRAPRELPPGVHAPGAHRRGGPADRSRDDCVLIWRVP